AGNVGYESASVRITVNDTQTPPPPPILPGDPSGQIPPPPPPPPPTTSCGDGACNGTETCSTCASDCGACPTAGSYTAKRASAAPTIDGQLTEYAEANTIVITNSRGTTGTYRLLWDSTALYIAAQVSDTQLAAIGTTRDGSLWNDDAIEMIFDTLNNRGTTMNSDDYKFFVNVLNVQNDSQIFNTSWNASFTSRVSAQGTVNQSGNTDTGYVIEIAIPWSAWRISVPAANTTWGFDLAQDDRNDLGQVVQTVWTNSDDGDFNNPAGWGSMVLSSLTANVGGGGTDTVNPVVASFSIAPTSLSVGSSITANYTVTDNVALQRAELWRAPQGTNCTDTAKTGCVWSQVTSANITGTTRTGTFTSTLTAAGTFYYGLHAVDASGNTGYEQTSIRVTANSVPTPPPPPSMGCGDGTCNGTETCSTCASDCGACPIGQLPIFPGAAGFGTLTRAAYGGGSNPTVHRVTNLNASGSGSLQGCVAASGPRICVFEVSGTIRITSDLAIRNPYITIAGQTAPNPGIMIRGAALAVATHDVLVQHIRVRAGDAAEGPSKDNRDSLKIDNDAGNTYNVVIDHCSFSWSVDENASVWHPGLHDVSFINSILSEALHIAGHPSYPAGTSHSMGFIVGSGINRVTVAYSLLAHNNERNIRLSDGSAAEEINNVVYNWGSRAVDTEGDINVIGNHFITGQNTDMSRTSIYLRSSAARVYTRDNIYAPTGNVSSPIGTVSIPNSCILPSNEVLDYVLGYTGARPASRDRVDNRIMNELRARTGGFKNTVEEAGGWENLTVNNRSLTTPTNPHGDSDGDGYTNLEEWLHNYSSQAEGGLSNACGR
ncbi:MAG: sugar-binding protein, partial [Candidatus Falkowbacteria bacterium]